MLIQSFALIKHITAITEGFLSFSFDSVRIQNQTNFVSV